MPATNSVTANAAQLGADFAQRYSAIDANLEKIRDILVSDWGKVKVAAHNTENVWNWSTTVNNNMINALTISAKQEFWTAMLSSAYVEYVVDPKYLWYVLNKQHGSTWSAPWQVACQSNGSGNTYPVGGGATNQSSWMTGTVAMYPQPYPYSQLDWFGITTKAQYAVNVITSNPRTAPQALTAPLFQPIDQSEGTTLGMDKVAFFADPRWRRLWFTCAGAY